MMIREKYRKKEYKMYNLGRKRIPGNLMLEPWFVLNEMRRNCTKPPFTVRW